MISEDVRNSLRDRYRNKKIQLQNSTDINEFTELKMCRFLTLESMLCVLARMT